jgi:uncharacterized phage-like protein YoqJ
MEYIGYEVKLNLFKGKQNKMKAIKKIIKTQLVNLNIKPVKVVILPTGIVCEHFKNGNIKVI